VRLGRGCRDRPPRHRGEVRLYRLFLLGIATGLLWPPARADPGLDPDRRGLKGASAQSSLLLFAYAAGAATSLALALVIGGRVFNAMSARWARGVDSARVGGGVALRRRAIALGLDTGLLTSSPWPGPAASNRGWSTRSHPDRRRRSRVDRSGSGRSAPDRRKPAVARRSGRVVKLSPANREGCAEKSCWSTSGPTPASTAFGLSPHSGLGREVQRPGAGGGGRTRPRVRLREGPGQRPAGGPGAESRLPGAVDNDLPSGGPSTTGTGRRTISWMRRAGTAPPLWRRGV